MRHSPDGHLRLIKNLDYNISDKSEDFFMSLTEGYGFEFLGEVKDFEDLPESMSIVSKRLFLKKSPIRKLKMGEVTIYIGRSEDDGKHVPASMENGNEYLGYDEYWERDHFFKTVTDLVGVIKLPGSF